MRNEAVLILSFRESSRLAVGSFVGQYATLSGLQISELLIRIRRSMLQYHHGSLLILECYQFVTESGAMCSGPYIQNKVCFNHINGLKKKFGVLIEIAYNDESFKCTMKL